MKRIYFTFFAILLLFLLVLPAGAGESYYDSGGSAIATTAYPFRAISASATSGGRDAKSFEIRIKFASAVSDGTLTVTIDSGTNSKYDIVLESYDFSKVSGGVTTCVRIFDNYVKAGDAVVVAQPNAGGVTWGMEIVWKE